RYLHERPLAADDDLRLLVVGREHDRPAHDARVAAALRGGDRRVEIETRNPHDAQREVAEPGLPAHEGAANPRVLGAGDVVVLDAGADAHAEALVASR